ncbi:MAG: AAA family ATPase [Nitrospira sp.]|nr:AAA family ATPase [Nitrospira sp.]
MRLLGELEVRRGSEPPLPLPPSRRTRALLGYLVATGAPQSRSALCDLLWDGPDDPRAALRWSLTKLRPVVDDATTQRLRADRDKVAFDALDCEVDSVSIGAALGHGALGNGGEPASGHGAFAQLPLETLEASAQALQREFLDGLDLPACYRFQHWCMAERERFARLRRGVLEALVTRLADDPQRALQHGRAMVAADPLAEAAHATLVRLLAAAGRYPEAEQHHGWARDLLRREVALPDGGALDQAIRAVRQAQRQLAAPRAPSEPRPATLPAAHSTAQTAAHPAAHPTAHPTAQPAARSAAHSAALAELARATAPAPAALVGRSDECRAIEATLAASDAARVQPSGEPPTHSTPRPQMLLLVGEPGIGKTRLLDHLAERATTLGRRVLRARCFEAEAVRPYGFWLDALRGVPTDHASAQVLDRAAPLLGGNAAAVSRAQLFDATAELLNSLAQAQPLAVLIDDLQWIDDASAALLHFVARRLATASQPLLLAAAARAGEVDDNAGAKGLLHSLAREHALQQLDLGPLAEDDVRRWLGERLGDVGAAMRASGGNPLFLLELVRAGGDVPTARPLAALLDDRLRAFDAAGRDLLGWAAALGDALIGEFGIERLAAATALPVADVLARIAHFERRGLLRANAAGGFDFAHDLVRQAVYRALSAPRRCSLHRQIARVLADAAVQDPWQHGAVVHHASLAGDATLATRAALAAGEHWLRVFANVEAAQVAERGLASIDAMPAGTERARLEIALLRLRVTAAAAPGGRLPDLVARIERAIDAAQVQGLHADASAGWEILAYWRQQAGDAVGAHDATLAAERSTRLADSVTRCQQLANSGRCLLDIEADGERGRALLADAAALAGELQLPVMELEWGRGLAARADGDLPRACESLARAVALARAAANHWREYECMLALATAEYELERVDDVLRHVDDVAAAARRMGETRVPFAEALAALAHRRRGDADAPASVAASLAVLRERDDKAHLAYALNETAAFALADGDAQTAQRHAEEAFAAASAVRRPTLITRARAIIAAAQAANAPARAATASAQGANASAQAAPASAQAVPASAQAANAAAQTATASARKPRAETTRRSP